MTDLAELLAFARDVSSALPGAMTQPLQWMHMAGDLAHECLQGAGLRPALSAAIPLPERGGLRRAVSTLEVCSSSFDATKAQSAREALEVIMSTLEKAVTQAGTDTGAWLADRPGQRDPMGAANRQAFEEDLVAARREATPSAPLAFVISDANDFKRVNDLLGHDVGDRVIRQLATHHMSVARGRGKAYRLGGDEFVILLPNTTGAEATATAERLKDQIAQSPVDGVDQPITVSVGVATATDGGADIYPLADDALRRAKKAQKDRVTSAPGPPRDSTALAQADPGQQPQGDSLSGRPSDIPAAILRSIQEKVERDWPESFTMRLFALQREIDAYRKLTRLEPPQDALSPEALSLLRAASGTGEIAIHEDDQLGRRVRVEREEFVDAQDPAVAARHLDALEALVSLGLARHEKGSAYMLTGPGFERARALRG